MTKICRRIPPGPKPQSHQVTMHQPLVMQVLETTRSINQQAEALKHRHVSLACTGQYFENLQLQLHHSLTK